MESVNVQEQLLTILKSGVDKAKLYKKITAGVLAVALAGAGYLGWQHFRGPAEITASAATRHEGEEVKMVVTVVGGIKTANRVLLNNFSVPQGTRFADRRPQDGDITLVIDKTHPLYGSFSGRKLPNRNMEILAVSGTYEVIGTAGKFNGHPQIVVREMKPKS